MFEGLERFHGFGWIEVSSAFVLIWEDAFFACIFDGLSAFHRGGSEFVEFLVEDVFFGDKFVGLVIDSDS